MKNLVIILVIVFWAWYFYNLWENRTNINNAKKELGIITQEDNSSEDKKEDKKEIELDNKEEVKNNDWVASYTVNNLDNKNYIEIDNLSEKVKNITEKITITWKVLNANVDKIIISFKNGTSDYPNDIYELQNFKKWNTTFKYNADWKLFRNLDYWVNKYTIEAYIWTYVSRIELEITIPENLWETEDKTERVSEDITYDKKLIGSWDDAIYIGLPSSDLFWTPLNLDNGIITYSNIDWFELQKDDFNVDNITIDNIWNSDWTWYLNENIDWYVYWNTFREIDYSNKDSWVSFYILRKSWDKFIYEKMYFDFNHNLKWILKIDEFPVDSEESVTDQMAKLNTELKEKNSDFEIVKTTDKLFKEVVR